jgi:diaminopimelate decarboxylase
MFDPYWNGIPLREIAARTGTPVVILSEARLRANVRDLRAGLGAGAVLRYCAKTNPEARVLRLVAEEGAHLLASHEAEVHAGLEAGVPAAAIAFQRPVLDEREVESVVRLGVRRLHAFRAGDLDLLSRVARRMGVLLRVSLRIALARRGMFVLAAASRRLGFSGPVADPARDGLAVDALNTYIGTQQENPEAYRGAVRALAQLAARIGTVEELNLGGGVPSPTLRRVTAGRLLRRKATAPALSLAAYAASLRRIFDEEVKAPMRLALEPGRSIAGNAAVVIASVAASQERWRFLDCGRNVLVESPLAFTRGIAPLEPGRGTPALVHISGPTLNTIDVVDMYRRLPELRTGDLVAIGDAGAYTLSRATRYAGLLPAVVLLRSDGSLETIHAAETCAGAAASLEVR